MKNKADLAVYKTATFLLAILTGLVLFVLNVLGAEKSRYKLAALTVKVLGGELLNIRTDYDPVLKKTAPRAILALPGRGCSYYFRSGGCAMCGFNKEIEKYRLRYFYAGFVSLLIRLVLIYAEKEIADKKIRNVFLFNGGSFLNLEEISYSDQEYIIGLFAKSDIEKLTIESRAEYILAHESRLRKYAGILTGKKLEIATGLESSDDHTRNKVIKKNLPAAVYSAAVRAAERAGTVVNTYVLIGAPGLTEPEIIDQAVKSVIFAWGKGSDTVSLETYCVQAGTPWSRLYDAGELVLPSLWSIAAIIKRVGRVSSMWYLGEFSDWPKPVAVPANCPACTGRVMAALAKLRLTHDMKVLSELPACACRNNFSIMLIVRRKK